MFLQVLAGLINFHLSPTALCIAYELHQIWPHVEQSSIFPLERDLAILKSSYRYGIVSAVTEVEEAASNI